MFEVAHGTSARNRGLGFGVALAGQTRCFQKFTAIWRDDRRTTIGRPIAPFGIDQDRLADSSRLTNRLAQDPIGQQALAVVGYNHNARRRNRGVRSLYHPVFELWGQSACIFKVDASDLLMGAYDTKLLGRRALCIDDDPVAQNTALTLKCTNKAGARLVSPGDADNVNVDAKRREIADDVCRPAGHLPLRAPLDDGDRRLRRNALDIAMKVAIEHEVADHGDGAVLEIIQRGALSNSPCCGQPMSFGRRLP